jgi:hypothetical protein
MRPPLLLVTARRRAPDRLENSLIDAGPDDPSIEALVAAAGPGPLLLGGGEPTLRADLPALLRALCAAGAAPTLDTDGLALSSPAALAALRGAGLAGLRLRLHSLEPEAHDYLEGMPGAHRRALIALARALDDQLPVEVLTPISRPSAPLLLAMARGLAPRGARTAAPRWTLRWPDLADPDLAHLVAVQPRPALIEDHVLAAVREGVSLGLRVQVEGLPSCVAPGLDPALRVAAPALRDPGGFARARAPAARCAGCAEGERAGCPGFSAAWVQRFGDAELRSERPGPRAAPPPPLATASGPPPAPPPRAGRAPLTRPRDLRRLARWPGLAGDPSLATAGAAPAGPLALDLVGPSRAARAALARVAQERPPRLVVGPPDLMDRPDAVDLLRDALRISVPDVIVRARPHGLAAVPDRALVGLRGLQAWVWPLADGAAPDAAGIEALARLHRLSGAAVGVCGGQAPPPAPLLQRDDPAVGAAPCGTMGGAPSSSPSPDAEPL